MLNFFYIGHGVEIPIAICEVCAISMLIVFEEVELLMNCL